MAATAKLLQLRPKTIPITTTITTASTSIYFSSSFTTPDPNNTPSSQSNPPPLRPPQSQSQSQSPFASHFSDIRAGLEQLLQRNPQQSQPPRKPLSFSSSISDQPSPPSKFSSLEEIRRHLSELRRRSDAPAPPPLPSSSSSSSNRQPSHSPQSISLQELYQRNVASKGEESGPDASKAAQKLSFEAIRVSLRQLKSSSSKNQSQGGGGMTNPMSLSRFNDSLMMRPLDSSKKSSQQRVFGGSDHLPLSIFGPEIKKEEEEGDTSADGKMRMEFLRTYTHKELGKKLRALRPEKQDKKDWFSLEELSERLVKLREMEEKESDSKLAGFSFQDSRESLQKLRKEEAGSGKSSMHRLDILGQLGGTPGHMLSLPKEELVEKCFHPDNMSASEKLKLEIRKVRDEFKIIRESVRQLKSSSSRNQSQGGGGMTNPMTIMPRKRIILPK